MKNKFARYEDGKVVKYEFYNEDELREWIHKQLTEFRKVNSVRNEAKDRAYIAYKSELEELLI